MITILDLKPLIQLSPKNFYCLCRNNPDVSLELTGNEELVIMSPVGGESGNREANLIADVIAVFRRVRTLNPLLSKGFSHFICPSPAQTPLY